jgi:cation transport protein ChaC
MRDHPAIPLAAVRPLSDEERRESLAKALAKAPAGEPLRIFAYGSLIWSPCFDFDEAATATLGGYRRAFNFWTIQTRGTPEMPGLGLGLEPEPCGRCEGVLYRLSENTAHLAMEAIWAREMLSAVYEPRWLPVRTSGGMRQALCFVTNPAHEQYAGILDSETVARIIARACGIKGTCRDYLADAVRALARHGLADPHLDALLALVDRQAPTPNGSAAPRS